MKVLVTLTDVEPAVRLNALLEAAGFETVLVSPLDDIRGEIRRAKPNLIVLTGGIADPSSIQLVKEQLWEGGAVIGLADVEDPELVERLRSIGFVDVYAKPIAPEDLLSLVRRALDRQRLVEVTGLIGQSNAIREVLVKIEQIAPVSSTVLVEGESGTGKELVARAIHRLSPRRNRHFIAVNVGALAETLVESELFGHEKGAFTGAAERRLGRFELANGGTIFLDEISEIPPATQVRLLRVLEERELTRVGGATPIKVDVRVVAATNQPLRQRVEEGHFRSDLYYRLNVLSMYLPPLRQRPDDIPLLVRRFVREYSAQHDRPFHGISAEAMQILVAYAWPGNVRELRNLVESMVVLSPGREVGAGDIPREIREGGTSRFLPVHVGPVLRGAFAADGRELEFIVRTLVELKLQIEELRSRVHDISAMPSAIARESSAVVNDLGMGDSRVTVGNGREFPDHMAVSPRYGAIEAPDQSPPLATVTIAPGMTMAEIEKLAISGALAATKGNRRKAAEMLGIGERTMYRKLREYGIPVR
ncbi:MAG: sigma-54-dependent Fis family transcriptional regulator [Gemmatimonadaceae bacterium]|nr:sigma-54-dependent Fis family transcriptional regulator [Gemmatimonadaceae bacterium]